jgi:hypothetical protein
MKYLRLQFSFNSSTIFLFVCLSTSALSQQTDSMCTEKEFLEILKWDLKQTRATGLKGLNFRILNKTQWWGNLIIFPSDSAETYDFFKAICNRVGYLDSLPTIEKQNLRQQFNKSEETWKIDQMVNRNDFTENFLSGNRTTLAYSIPLIIRNRQIFVLRKDYVINNGYIVDIEIRIYKRKEEGSFHLLRAYSL